MQTQKGKGPKIVPIKGAEFDYRAFLWGEIREIRIYQRNKFFLDAVEYAVTLMDYLPEDFQIKEKMDLQRRAQTMLDKINSIKINQTYQHRTEILTKNERTRVARLELRKFMSYFCIKLDKKGYMEDKGGLTPRGHE